MCVERSFVQFYHLVGLGNFFFIDLFFQINQDLHLKKQLLLIIIDTLWFCKEGEIDFIYLSCKSKFVYML